MDPRTLIQLNEAYRNEVYSQEEILSEEEYLDIQEWVEALIDEGYDLDQYTDDELYEAYLAEMSNIIRTGTSTNAAGERINWTHTHNPSTGRSTVKDKFGSRDATVKSLKDKNIVKSKFREELDLELYEAYLADLEEAKVDSGLTSLQKIRKRNRDQSLVSNPGGQTRERRDLHIAGRGVKKFEDWSPGANRWEREAEIKKRYGVEYDQTGRREQIIKAIKHPSSYPRVGGEKGLPESYDLYDLVSEYLVSEGFCDSYEDADVIMANMSEEWREGIIEEVLDEANRPEREMIKKGLLKPGQVGRVRNLNRAASEQGGRGGGWYDQDLRNQPSIQRPGRSFGRIGPMQLKQRRQREAQKFDAFYADERKREHRERRGKKTTGG